MGVATIDQTTRPPGSPAHREVVATLVTAFSADPIVRWLYPDAHGYLTHFPELLHVLGGVAFEVGTADRRPAGAGAALWVPPGTPSDEAGTAELLERSIAPDRQGDVAAFAEQVQEHHPDGPHWFLPFMGVDPRAQGQGHGSALLAHGLTRADGDRLPAYLEASSPRNRALYERHGFEVVGEIQAGGSPPLWPMLRPAA